MSSVCAFIVVLCAVFMFDVGDAVEYEQFKMDVDATGKPEEYRSLRDYASPILRSSAYSTSHFANPYQGSHLTSTYGQEQVTSDDLHSYPSMKNFFISKQMVSFNPFEKKTPYWMKMSAVDKPYPFYMPKPYSLTTTMEKPTAGNVYPALKMYATAFLPMKFDKPPMNVPLFVSKPATSYVSASGLKDRYIFGHVATSEKPSSTGLKIPFPIIEQYDKRVPIQAPAPPYSAIVEKYPIYVPHEKLIPVSMEKTYPMQYQLEKPIPYPMYPAEKAAFSHLMGLQVPVRIPFEVPAPLPVNVAMTRHEPQFIPVEEPRASSTTDQDSLAFKPQLFMSTALLQQLAIARANASVHRPISSSSKASHIDENTDIESEGTDIVNEYESLKTASNRTSAITSTTRTTTTLTTPASMVVTSPQVNLTTTDTLRPANETTTQRV